MDSYFLKMIRQLRHHEEVIVFSNTFEIDEEDGRQVTDFLALEYQREAFDYPYNAPGFNSSAALWAAKTVYTAGQLILHREITPTNLTSLLPPYLSPIDPSAVLSADLCLRFLPDMIVQLKLIDGEDPLIDVLEKILAIWHYSGINYSLPADQLDFTIIDRDKCLHQMYVNQVIRCKKLSLALHPCLVALAKGNLGLYATDLWKEFSTATVRHE